MNFSQATEANWRRLKPDIAQKLKQGANKSRSGKVIFPLEYLRCRENLAFAEKVLTIAQKKELSRENVIFSIACLLLKKHNIFDRDHVQNVLAEYKFQPDPGLTALDDLPLDEWDILGFIYQCMQKEGEKNLKGSYFTPENIAKKMLQQNKLADGERFLDPACGSGSILLAMDVQQPEQLWGCDLDGIAVFIAKVNLLCKYKECEFTPQIYQYDFLSDKSGKLFEQKFKSIASNPPWGAKIKQTIKTPWGNFKDSFSLFLLKSYSLLDKSGCMSFLLPQAILNIKRHKNIRLFMLNNCCLRKIEYIPGSFTGVMTGCVNINISKAPAASVFTMIRDGQSNRVKISDTASRTGDVFCYKNCLDENLIEKINQQKKYDLSGSIFALGIVTGNNAGKLFETPQPGSEPIYTGKEEQRYKLLNCRKYLFYDRTQFQQVAKDEYYRAGEKLVYKFISKELVFAYDNTGSLLLNSANMLIPQIPQLSIKTVLALLNSEVLRYYYKVRFGDVKILKGNLTELPLPYVKNDLQMTIEEQVDLILQGRGSDSELQKMIYQCYQLTAEEITYIKSCL